MAQGIQVSPTELRLKKGGAELAVTFDNGDSVELSAEYLRVESPSAEVQGHSLDQRKWIGGKKDVTITKMEPVGRYAVQLTFSDGHDTGIYPWEVLNHLGKFHTEIWRNYLSKIAERGLKREA